MLNDILTQFKLLWAPYQIRTVEHLAETILLELDSAYAPKYNIFTSVYDRYLKICKQDNTKPLTKVELHDIFRTYGMSLRNRVEYVRKVKPYVDTPKQKTYYGIEIDKERLEELIRDCKQVVVSDGTTIVMQNDWPYYMRVTMVPVENKVAEVILGKSRDLKAEKKTLEN